MAVKKRIVAKGAETVEPVPNSNCAYGIAAAQTVHGNGISDPRQKSPLGLGGMMAQFQRVTLPSAILWSETLTRGLRELGMANNPMQLLLGTSNVLSNQLDAVLMQQATLMRQLLDAKLQVNGQRFRNHLAEAGVASGPHEGRILLDAWSKAQDDWLSLSRNWKLILRDR